MQDKLPIFVYGGNGTHISNLLLDFIDKFGSRLIDEKEAYVKLPEPLSLRSITQSCEIVNQMNFCASIKGS